MANELPLFIVVKMIKHAIKKETEQQIYPLWLVHVVTQLLQHQEFKSIEEFMPKQMENQNMKKSDRTSEQILADFNHIVEIDKKRGGK